MITDKDIANIEVLHDRLMDIYGEKASNRWLTNARETTAKMYEIVGKPLSYLSQFEHLTNKRTVANKHLTNEPTTKEKNTKGN
ncbi:unnamed protein product [marine sediment metagenome]|uniref:Uncharacterized protein n=1 Tax=marine sediment metagenome TaxID=412755 RepID=X0VC25_9ZZZZ